jgi:type IV secretory pathway VirB4 component
MKTPFKLGGVVSDKSRYKDNIAWWMSRYESLCTTEAEDIIRKAVAKFNDAVALRDQALDLIEQLDQDIIEAEHEIKRLGGAAFIEKSEPMIEELTVYFDNLYESLKRPRSEDVELAARRGRKLE